ncbi:gluconate 2-dehydrogenase subunit 3 family protein [Rubrolithibacter danxiaensis]|uniref:gluconate 2-dehydrogenase subunit 3 family protein n=1 Tax=Rubrolithibacter danxiaensis TaxID=3390805 RepID=UPI003BF7E326
MDRRSAVKSFLIAGSALAFFPSCLQDKKITSVKLKNLSIDQDQEKLLGEITETLIPKTDTPGAKDLSLHLFVLKMMDDLFEKEQQEKFVKGLDQIDEIAEKNYNNRFVKLTAPQREELLNRVEKKEFSGDVQSFYPLMKQLTITGYLNSKYVMTKLRVYELVPARFHGCVPVKKVS